MFIMQLLILCLMKYWLDIIVQFLLMAKLELEKHLLWKVLVMIHHYIGKV